MKPFKHQQIALDKSRGRHNFAYLMEMGTGKTGTDIWDTDYWFSNREIDGWIIVAPKGVYNNWPDIELPKFASFHYRSVVYAAGAGVKLNKKLDDICSGPVDSNVLDILVINIESLANPKCVVRWKAFCKSHQGVKVSIDESTRIKSHTAKRTKASWKLSQLAKVRRILTGFPYPKAPLDAFAQFYFLDSSILKYENWYAFRSHYAILKTMDVGPNSFKQVVGFQNLDELQERVEKASYRALKADCLDLPPKMYSRVDVSLTPEQERVYKEVKDYGYAELLEKGESVTVQHVLTQILRQHQVVCGHVAADDGKGIRRLPNNRIKAALETTEEMSGKCLVWSNFVPMIEDLIKAFEDRYGPNAVVNYYGNTSVENRKTAITRFQEDPECRFFIGNPATGGMGITLTAASNEIYASNAFNLEHRLQSEDRAHRIGQDNPVNIIDISCPGTVDEKIITALVTKKMTAHEAMGESWQSWI